MKAGSLRRRANGTWQYRASYGSSYNGKPVTRSASFPATLTQTQAEARAREMRGKWDDEHRRGMASNGTLGKLVTEWADDAEHSPTTKARQASIVARIVADLGGIKLADLTARDLDRWYKELAKPRKITDPNGTTRTVTLSPNTIRHYHRVLRAALAKGYKWEAVDRNVADRATPPKHVRTDQAEYMPTVPALAVMLSKASPVARMAVLLSVTTGCRRGEVVALRWADLRGSVLHVGASGYKLAGRAVEYKTTKSGIEKRIPLPPALLTELAAWRTHLETQAALDGNTLASDAFILPTLFADTSGRVGFPPNWYSKEWQRLCGRAGVRFKLHGLRHLHGSLGLDGGASAAAMAKRQGHGVEVMLDRYVHPVDGADLEAMEIIGTSLAPLFSLPPAPTTTTSTNEGDTQ
jgi:integrase